MREHRVGLLVPMVAAVVAFAATVAMRWAVYGAEVSEWIWLLSFLFVVGAGAYILLASPGHRVGGLLVAGGVLVEVSAAIDAYASLANDRGWLGATHARWGQQLLWLPALWLLVVEVPLRIPDGSPPTPRWRLVSRIAVGAVIAATAGAAVRPGPMGEQTPLVNPFGIDAVKGVADVLSGAGGLVLVCGVAAWGSLLVRVRRARPEERRALRTVARGIGVTIGSLVVGGVVGIGSEAAGAVAAAVAIAAIPVAIAVAIVRHRLFGIDVVVGRAIVATGWAVLVAATYAAVVAAGAAIAGESFAVQIVGAVAVAGLAAPVRRSLEGVVDRFLYGDRGDPLRTTRAVVGRAAAAGVPSDVVADTVAEIRQALRLPYVGVRAADGTVIASGEPATGAALAVLPMRWRGLEVGALEAAPRFGEQALGRRDRLLLADLADALGPSVHAAELYEELRRARDRLLAVRDDERERIRRDLHDGIAPTVAGLVLHLDLLIDRLPVDARPAAERLGVALRALLDDVRRLVHGLRPAVLDELGLATAIERHARAVEALSDLHVSVTFSAGYDAVEPPAPVESAVWFVVSEALTNTSRHARARTCEVRVHTRPEVIIVEVMDDGVGLSANHAGGLGLGSMRQRIADLGGHFEACSDGTGTTVRAAIPFAR